MSVTKKLGLGSNIPTAQMSVTETAVTPSSRLNCVPTLGLTLGLGTTLHFLPVHCSMRVCSTPLAFMKLPTAQTSLVETAVTPFRVPACFGALTVRHAVPFQCAMSGGAPTTVNPTAQTSLVETAATPRNLPFATVGLGTMLHAVPFQCSVSVPLLLSPTAQTSLAEILATPVSVPTPGLGTTVQGADCACANLVMVARSTATDTTTTVHETRPIFKRFMILLTSH